MAPRRDLHRSSFVILAPGLLSVGPVGVLAQTTTAVCLSSFDWMNNSKSQNPCAVSAYLQGACHGGQFVVYPLPIGTHYIGPYADAINECQCSSVTYNTISACGLCQNRTIISWGLWDANCTSAYLGSLPAGIPSDTAVPAWAFQDVRTSGQFDVTLAQSVGDSPESTASAAQSTSSLGTTSTVSGSLTNSPSSSSTSSPLSSGGGSNTGVIAGGVVGVVAGVTLIAGVVAFFVMKKKRSRVLPSAQPANHSMSLAHSTPYTGATAFVSPMAQPRLYDPSDPSTFPTSLPLTTITNAPSNNVQDPAIGHSSPSVHLGRYGGMPEV